MFTYIHVNIVLLGWVFFFSMLVRPAKLMIINLVPKWGFTHSELEKYIKSYHSYYLRYERSNQAHEERKKNAEENIELKLCTVCEPLRVTPGYPAIYAAYHSM